MGFQIAVDDPLVLNSQARSGRPKYPSEEEAQRIFEYTISTPENRPKTALQIINELQIPGIKKGKLLSVFKFQQIMFDRGYGRGFRGWKTILDDEHKEKRLAFGHKYEHFDWVSRGVSTDEAKASKAEPDRGKSWRAPGEELSSNVIGRKNLDYDKTMCQISAQIAHGFKSKLIFVYTETDTEKEEAKG